jgi:hypothetical protein
MLFRYLCGTVKVNSLRVKSVPPIGTHRSELMNVTPTLGQGSVIKAGPVFCPYFVPIKTGPVFRPNFRAENPETQLNEYPLYPDLYTVTAHCSTVLLCGFRHTRCHES